MTNAKALREALTAAGASGLNESKLADCTEITIADLRKAIWAMVNRGEIEKTDQDGVVTYTLDPDYSANRKLPVKRKPKKKKDAKKPRGGGAMPKRKTTLRQIAKRVAAASSKPHAVALALENLKAAGAHLASTVRVEVEGVDNNPVLQAAIEQHERAAALVEALA